MERILIIPGVFFLMIVLALVIAKYRKITIKGRWFEINAEK